MIKLIDILKEHVINVPVDLLSLLKRHKQELSKMFTEEVFFDEYDYYPKTEEDFSDSIFPIYTIKDFIRSKSGEIVDIMENEEIMHVYRLERDVDDKFHSYNTIRSGEIINLEGHEVAFISIEYVNTMNKIMGGEDNIEEHIISTPNPEVEKVKHFIKQNYSNLIRKGAIEDGSEELGNIITYVARLQGNKYVNSDSFWENILSLRASGTLAKVWDILRIVFKDLNIEVLH
jgi:hypothetical protein